MEHRSTEIETAKDLTLKVIEQGLLRLTADEVNDAEAAGKKVAALYNAILESLKL